MISPRVCTLIDPRPAYHNPDRHSVEMDNMLRIPAAVSIPAKIQPTGTTELRNSPAHLEQMISKKRNKPLMEKRRRQRINHALEELRRLVTDPTTKTASKLEKADILDLTVKFVKECISSRRTPQHQEPPSLNPRSSAQIFVQGHIACELALRKLLDQCISRQTKNSTLFEQSLPQLINHMLTELSTNRQQLVCRFISSTPTNLRCSNSAFSPVTNLSSSSSSVSSTSPNSSNPIRLPFASSSSSTSTESFPDPSPSQLFQLNTHLSSEHSLGLPIHNSTPARICPRTRTQIGPIMIEVGQPSDDMANQLTAFPTSLTTTPTTTSDRGSNNLWRPW